MTAPIRVWRRWSPGYDPRREYPPTDRPWVWRCHHGGWTPAVKAPPCAHGLTFTQPEALAAGLAHLATHTETT